MTFGIASPEVLRSLQVDSIPHFHFELSLDALSLRSDVISSIKVLAIDWGLSDALIVPLFRGSRRCESLILAHHSRFNVACECDKEEINDGDDVVQAWLCVQHSLAGLVPGYLAHKKRPPPRITIGP